ncbi:HAD-IA family hydrolase [Psychromonas arctica]|uniref:HAD-IA family hydrolase n=1 Tax=Psychromonas arctica TaxID=168275 RepID=UPI002FD0289D
MIFYKTLRPFKAISFDLDDTLYDNEPVIIKAEKHFLDYLKSNYPKLAELEERRWNLYKALIVKEDPNLKHDVTAWRKAAIQRVMIVHGIAPVNAITYSETALQTFIALRSEVDVPNQSIELLQQLAKHYPVVAITNGNVDVEKIGLQDKFQFVLKAGNGFKSKPDIALFQQAADQLNIKISDILHVGDHLNSDVFGAQQHDAQAVWFNPNGSALDGAKLLPTIEMADLQDLLKLL